MKNMRIGTAALAAVMLAVTLLLQSSPAYAREAWQQEFEDVCSKADAAAELTTGELKILVEKCDKLRPVIETLDESASKVYLKRLQRCRGLFVYILQLKEQEQGSTYPYGRSGRGD